MPTSPPVLTTKATTRQPGQNIPGRYCDKERMWVVPLDDGEIALISKCQELAAMTTKTKVELESDDTSDFSGLQLLTKTDTQSERDDESRTVVSMLALQTKTEANTEQDKQDVDALYAGVLALETKTFASQEEDQVDTDRRFSVDSVPSGHLAPPIDNQTAMPLPLAVRLFH